MLDCHHASHVCVDICSNTASTLHQHAVDPMCNAAHLYGSSISGLRNHQKQTRSGRHVVRVNRAVILRLSPWMWTPSAARSRYPSAKQGTGFRSTKQNTVNAIPDGHSRSTTRCFQHYYLELGASARKTLRRGPLPSFSTASCITSIARAAAEALSNLM